MKIQESLINVLVTFNDRYEGCSLLTFFKPIPVKLLKYFLLALCVF